MKATTLSEIYFDLISGIASVNPTGNSSVGDKYGLSTSWLYVYNSVGLIPTFAATATIVSPGNVMYVLIVTSFLSRLYSML